MVTRSNDESAGLVLYAYDPEVKCLFIYLSIATYCLALYPSLSWVQGSCDAKLLLVMSMFVEY